MLLIVQIAEFVAWLALLAGSLLLYLRLRDIASTSFLLSIVVITAWAFWLQDVLLRATRLDAAVPEQGANAAQAIAAIGHSQAIVAACDSILVLWFGISFFLAIKSIRSQCVV